MSPGSTSPPAQDLRRRAAQILFALAAVLGLGAEDVRAGAPEVVVSVKPIHSIVAAVMAGVAAPWLVVGGSASPHDYALRPSDAMALSRADLVFWVGKDFELFLAKPIAALAGEARVVTLMDIDGLTRLALGAGGAFDPHIWLDPANARVIAVATADALSAADPDNRARYGANAGALAARLDALDGELRAALAPLSDLPYVVFHDAYGYFERRYSLAMTGAITVNPQHKPGAKRLRELRDRIRALGARCLFGEPQFAPALIDTLVEGSGARTGVLDPLGAALAPGPEAYFALMRGLAASLRACLTAP